MIEKIKIHANIKLILLLGIFFFMFGFLSIYLTFRYFEEINIETKHSILVILIILFALFFSSLVFSVNYISTIRIINDKILINYLFRKKVVKIESIKQIILSEIVNYYGISVERTKLILYDNKEINLYSFKYYNFYKLKIVLNHINKILISNGKIKLINFSDLNFPDRRIHTSPNEKYKTINFSFLISFSGLILLIFVLPIIYDIVSLKSIVISELIISIVFILLMLILLGGNANYFRITDKYLIVKNSIYFWKNRYIRLNDIESVVIYKYHRQFGKSIVIKTKYFENISISSDNLFEKNWNEFKDEIKSKNILILDNSEYISKKIFY